jgi:nitrilase
MARVSEQRVTVAIAQAESAATLDGALEAGHRLAREATQQGAQIVAFPETWIPGYPAWLDCCRDVALWDHAPVKAVYARMADMSIVVDGASGRALCDIARDVGAVLVIGVVERLADGPGRGTLYNSLLTIGADGTLLNHHRKLMPTFTERLLWGAGDADGLRAVRCSTTGARVGGLVCWEHWMPLARQALHESGEDVHVAAWPTVHETHQIASRHYAFEGRCFVLATGALQRASSLPPELEPHPDRVRGPDDWLLRGGSAVIGPDGRYVTEPVFEREAVIVAELDLRRPREENMTLDVTGHYQRPELFDFSVRRGLRSPGATSSRPE